jgi:hypothetical protein
LEIVVGVESAATLINGLVDHDAERVLQSVTERLVQSVGDLAADNEEEAREIIASTISRFRDEPVSADDVAPPAAEPADLVRATLDLLAHDPETAHMVRDAIAGLPEVTQMVIDPVTIGVVLAGVVAFLQTRFTLKVRKSGGKVNVEFSISKEAASEDTIKRVLKAVGGIVAKD